MMRVLVTVYLDTDHAVRGLVSIVDDGAVIQTVGSAVVGNTSELDHIIRAAVYTLNTFVTQGPPEGATP